ncbi:hypothetical protein [Arthrobacter sp. 35W]|uniref:hypothetical protein n=1 Tax=Arthrobacter sp. 35W TaxID=1132441 RepID=UPI00041DF070|nr:hypothetical protein [Arthrobacter sp. 35W]
MSTISITPGQRLYSAVSTAEIIVVKAASVELACTGESMLAARPESTTSAESDVAVQLGKRYSDEESGLLVLCTKGGPGPLTADGRVMNELQTAALPSSD